MIRFCPYCNSESEFSSSQFELKSGKCKLCVKNYDQKHYQDNKDTLKKQTKEYRANNKDKVATNKRLYLVNNRDVFRKALKKYKKSKSNDPMFKIRNSISSNIAHLLKKANSSKNGKSINDYLSYSFLELKEHLEKKFEPWMTWTNYGPYKFETWDDNDSVTWTWQLDHVVPQSELPYISMADENFQKCWALNNLRPLSAKQNLLDGVNRTRHQGVTT